MPKTIVDFTLYENKCVCCDYITKSKNEKLNKKMMKLHMKKNHPDIKYGGTDDSYNNSFHDLTHLNKDNIKIFNQVKGK